ncbi:ermin [Cyrtonyx montezumae]|uniref:ermin n=1 Tax=Cyrtonyx montezumae TaxID=9017 RepID=UPI0032D9FA9A
MSENVPRVHGVPACNGSAAPADGPPPTHGIADGIAGTAGTVPCGEAGGQHGAPAAKGNAEESENPLAGDVARGDCDGEERCGEKQEENVAALQQGAAEPRDSTEPLDVGACSPEPEEGQRGLGTASSHSGEAEGTPLHSTEQRENDAEEEEVEEEDSEEDEVQVIEVPKGSSESIQHQEGGTELFPPGSPPSNMPEERAGEQPGLGKKNDISRHSYSRYNTISYRKIRKGNTKQRIDEFESMMHL